MDHRILVAYAIRYGATAEIAEKIGQVLRQAGLPADVLPTDRVSDLTPSTGSNGGRRPRRSCRPTRKH